MSLRLRLQVQCTGSTRICSGDNALDVLQSIALDHIAQLETVSGPTPVTRALASNDHQEVDWDSVFKSINTIYTWDFRCRKQLLERMGRSWEPRP